MTTTTWLIGYTVTALELVALGVAARGLRWRLLPHWDGPWAVLASTILGLSLVVSLSLALGLVGLFRSGALLVLAIAVAVAISTWNRRAAGVPPVPPETVRERGRRGVRTFGSPTLGAAGAAIAIAVVSCTWVARVVSVYRTGSTDGDSLMYHLPFAARFVQTGSVTGIPHITPAPWVAVYPANVELLQAVAMLPFRHQVLVPVLNLGWLALVLLAGWCLGDLVSRGPLGAAMAAVVMAVPLMPATQSGTARVDTATVALVLAGVAIVLREPAGRKACLLAGLAVGLALGAKLATLPVAGTLLLSVGAVLWRRHGRSHAGIWVGGAVATGSFWYVRNWVATGSPVPFLNTQLAGVGPEGFPPSWLAPLEGTSILHFAGSPHFVSYTMRVAIGEVLGSLALAIALAVVAAATPILVAMRRPVGIVHAAVASALVGCIAYVVGPNGAPVHWGPLSSLAVTIVAVNTRYVLSSLALLLCLLPFALRDRVRKVDAVATWALAAYVSFLGLRRVVEGEWRVHAGDAWIAAAISASLGIGLLGTQWLRSRFAPRLRPVTVGLAWVVSATLVLTAFVMHTNGVGLRRYSGAPPDAVTLWSAAVHAGNRHIALLGDWVEYPLFGPRMENTVEYLGRPAGHGISRTPRTCAQLRRALQRGRYDAVVVQRGIFGTSPIAQWEDWIHRVPGGRTVVENSQGLVVDLPDHIESADAATCR